MSKVDKQTPPKRGPQHEALAVFLGTWRATGQSFGGPRQTKEAPRAHPTPWNSTHTGRWHSGSFFLIQDEQAVVDTGPFDTLSMLGVDVDTGRYFAQSVENHGFNRRYEVSVEGRVWTFTGHSERARIELSEDGNTQTIQWEWRPEDGWLPLCDRVAVKQ